MRLSSTYSSLGFVLSFFLLLSFAAGKKDSPPYFVDAAQETGIDVTVVFGGNETKKYILETTGTGVAAFDYDRDGKLDLIVANHIDFDDAVSTQPGKNPSCFWKGVPVVCGPKGLKPSHNILYHNDGNGCFKEVSTQAGIDQAAGHYA